MDLDLITHHGTHAQMKFWPVSKMFDPYEEEVRRVKAVELNQELWHHVNVWQGAENR